MTQPDPFLVHDDDPLRRVELAMADLRRGRMVILTDDEDRENEGDIVLAAQHVTPEAINFMATHARGLICLSMTAQQVERLGLPMMVTNNQSAYETAFTVSIEAREGVTTGISAADRAHTIQVAIRPDVHRHDIVTPGHIFPLRARPGGVLERVGQTEGSVDLARLAGLDPSAVICEIMNADGTMARMPDLIEFGKEHGIRIVSVADLIKYRMRNERIVQRAEEGVLDVPGRGRWHTRLYRGVTTDNLHMALWLGTPDSGPTLARVQAAPPSWSVLAPSCSNLSSSVDRAMEAISAEGRGAIVLMHLGGNGSETLMRQWSRDVLGAEAAAAQPTADALRDLGAGCQILRDLGLSQLKLMSNSRRPILGIEAYGLEIAERVALAHA